MSESNTPNKNRFEDDTFDDNLVHVDSLTDNLYDIVNFKDATREEELYLQQHILPVLVPALQDLLILKEDKEIDELNWLGSYLMRNNPKYNDEIKQHPYYKKLMKHLQKS